MALAVHLDAAGAHAEAFPAADAHLDAAGAHAELFPAEDVHLDAAGVHAELFPAEDAHLEAAGAHAVAFPDADAHLAFSSDAFQAPVKKYKVQSETANSHNNPALPGERVKQRYTVNNVEGAYSLRLIVDDKSSSSSPEGGLRAGRFGRGQYEAIHNAPGEAALGATSEAASCEPALPESPGTRPMAAAAALLGDSDDSVLAPAEGFEAQGAAAEGSSQVKLCCCVSAAFCHALGAAAASNAAPD